MASQQKREGLERTVPNPMQVQKFTGGPGYPIRKDDLLDRGRGKSADANVMEAVEGTADRRCDSLTAVSREVSRLD